MQSNHTVIYVRIMTTIIFTMSNVLLSRFCPKWGSWKSYKAVKHTLIYAKILFYPLPAMCVAMDVCVNFCVFFLCVWSSHLHRFVKGPIMMMICSLQWLYLDDLISSLSVGEGKNTSPFSSPPPSHPFRLFLSPLFSSVAMMLHSSVQPQKTLLSCIPAVTAWHGPLNRSLYRMHTHMHAAKHTHPAYFVDEWTRQCKALLLHNAISRLRMHTNTCSDNLPTELSDSSLQQTFEICHVFPYAPIHITLSAAASMFLHHFLD